MIPLHRRPQGVWLPLVTPFRDGAIDAASLRRLVLHYAAERLDGLILAATTGEGLALDEDEVARLVALTAEVLAVAGRRLPVFLGLSGSDTRKLVAALARTAGWAVDGYLIACPYYTRPSQEGMVRHFTELAAATQRPIMIYNIPYRTGVNLGNQAMLELASLPNIVGVKDCCAAPAQSAELLRRKPGNFAVLTGEDALFHPMLADGADGGIIASAHIAPRTFLAIDEMMRAGDLAGASAAWETVRHLPSLLFAEPSPAPIKWWLWRDGLIDSPEMRLPMMPVTAALATRIEHEVEGRTSRA